MELSYSDIDFSLGYIMYNKLLHLLQIATRKQQTRW